MVTDSFYQFQTPQGKTAVFAEIKYVFKPVSSQNNWTTYLKLKRADFLADVRSWEI
jgi:hypothetical protein